jgi:hypothetical protein
MKIIPGIPLDLGLFSFTKINPENHQKYLRGPHGCEIHS